MKEITINVFNTVGNSFCIDADDGNKVYNLIKTALLNEKQVVIDFQNVEIVTSAFLNTATGQVYRDFDETKIKALLSVQNLSPEDTALLKRVNDTAKLYHKDPERLEKSIKEILGE